MAPKKSTCGPLVRHSYVYRAAAALPFTAQAQESVRRVAVLMSNVGRAGIAGRPKRNLSQFVLSRAGCRGQSSGWPISLDKIVNPPEGDNMVA